MLKNDDDDDEVIWKGMKSLTGFRPLQSQELRIVVDGCYHPLAALVAVFSYNTSYEIAAFYID